MATNSVLDVLLKWDPIVYEPWDEDVLLLLAALKDKDSQTFQNDSNKALEHIIETVRPWYCATWYCAVLLKAGAIPIPAITEFRDSLILMALKLSQFYVARDLLRYNVDVTACYGEDRNSDVVTQALMYSEKPYEKSDISLEQMTDFIADLIAAGARPNPSRQDTWLHALVESNYQSTT